MDSKIIRPLGHFSWAKARYFAAPQFFADLIMVGWGNDGGPVASGSRFP
jgi:hypothetical protein